MHENSLFQFYPQAHWAPLQHQEPNLPLHLGHFNLPSYWNQKIIFGNQKNKNDWNKITWALTSIQSTDSRNKVWHFDSVSAL